MGFYGKENWGEIKLYGRVFMVVFKEERFKLVICFVIYGMFFVLLWYIKKVGVVLDF